MAKKTYKDPHTQIRNDVLEVLACSYLTAREFGFLFLLMRETFGRKNQDLPARGKMMPWDSSLFKYNMGFKHSSQVGRLKALLLDKRVIRQWSPDGAKKAGGPEEYCIGFNWHYNQWKCGFSRSIDEIMEIKAKYEKLSKKNNKGNKGVSSTESKGNKGVSSTESSGKQGRFLEETVVFPRGNSGVSPTEPKPAPDTDLQSLKKGKKEKKDRQGAKAPNGVSQEEGKSDPIFDGFTKLWNTYFAGGRDKKRENFKGTLYEYRKLVDGEEVTVDEVYNSLVKLKKTLERENTNHQYYPFLKTWLKEENWVEERKDEVVLSIHGETYTQEELAYAEQCWQWYIKYRDTPYDGMAEYQEYLKADRHRMNREYIDMKLREEKENE